MQTKRLLILITIVLLLTGCTKSEDRNLTGLAFKESYEALNGVIDKNGYEYRELDIPKDNPFIMVDINYILSKSQNKESFYLYIDKPTNQWGRSQINSIIKVFKENNIDTLYYLDISQDRDLLEYKNKTTAIIENGTYQYQQLLNVLKEVTEGYVLFDEFGDYMPAGEGRIYDGFLYYIKDGIGYNSLHPKSGYQFEYYDKLTSRALEEQERNIQSFIKVATKGKEVYEK